MALAAAALKALTEGVLSSLACRVPETKYELHCVDHMPGVSPVDKTGVTQQNTVQQRGLLVICFLDLVPAPLSH
eukprot:12791-Amphidinium_carterae.1